MKDTLTVALLLSPLLAAAQYPTLSHADSVRQSRVERLAEARADSAWRVAWPAVRREALAGRPYIPWAHRPTDLPQADVPCFPGAEGGGMYSFGGRGGRALTVTTLADDGPGSLRWACEQGGARTVVFNVSGTIELLSPLVIRAPYITIAGQTAPGAGVQVTGESVWIDTHDVVIRHMRFRRAATDVARRDDCLGGNPVGNIMLDHLSCEMGLDENISIYRHKWRGKKLPTVNVSLQHCLSAKALDTYHHAFGSTLGGENFSCQRCLWACNTGRNPSIGWNGVFNMVNCGVFNWRHRSVDGGDSTALYNMIGNYLRPGPATQTDSLHRRLLRPTGGRVHVSGNVVEGHPEVSADNWLGVQSDARHVPQPWPRPFPMPPITVVSAEAAWRDILANVGATRPVRDELDRRIVEEARTGLPGPGGVGGIITQPEQTGGLPTYPADYRPRVDSDGDGMPDDYERRHHLDPDDPRDAQVVATDGYTNLEHYLNELAQ